MKKKYNLNLITLLGLTFTIILISLLIALYFQQKRFYTNHFHNISDSTKKYFTKVSKNEFISYGETLSKVITINLNNVEINTKLLAQRAEEEYDKNISYRDINNFKKSINLKIQGLKYNYPSSDSSFVFISKSSKENLTSFKLMKATRKLDPMMSIFKNENDFYHLIYITATDSMVRMYPRTKMSKIVPRNAIQPDFSSEDFIFFNPASPKNNPERQFKWSNIYKAKMSQNWLISAMQPLYHNNIFLGVATIDIQLNKLYEAINLEAKKQNMNIMLATPDNKVLSTNNKTNSHFGFHKNELTEIDLNKSDHSHLKKLNKLIKGSINFDSVTVKNKKYYLTASKILPLNLRLILLSDEATFNQLSKNLINTTKKEYDSFFKSQIAIIVLAIILTFIILFLIIRHFLKPLKNLTYTMNEVGNGNFNTKVETQKISDFKDMESALLNMKAKLKVNQELFAKYKSDIAVGQIAAQVAHDIKSPLAALDIIANDLQQLPEEQRILIRSAIQRIHDIANDLSSKKVKEQNGDQKKDTYLITSILQNIISEKRVQFRPKAGVLIDSQIETNGYGLFAKIHLVEFKRTISNLINNAVEALPDEKGKVDIILGHDDDHIQIQIKDNGKGIPDEILPKLMNRGETHGKKTGSGLGLYHARQTIESFGGTIQMDSTLGIGTTIQISLPKQKAPKWFVENLKISANAKILILDDDNSIHQIWKNRFDKLARNLNMELIHFTNPQEFLEKFNANQADLYLVDYEFLGFDENGLDVIEKTNIAKKSILVTSHYEESDVQERCAKLGVKLIPKNLTGFVPIRQVLKEEKYPKLTVHQKNSNSSQLPLNLRGGEKVDAILIDDDPLVHMNWKIAAKKKSKNLKVYQNVFSFMGEIKNFSQDTPVYIDSNLEDGIKGEDEAIEINKLGFENIYLATGYTSEEFDEMPHIKAVVDKRPPW